MRIFLVLAAVLFFSGAATAQTKQLTTQDVLASMIEKMLSNDGIDALVYPDAGGVTIKTSGLTRRMAQRILDKTYVRASVSTAHFGSVVLTDPHGMTYRYDVSTDTLHPPET